MDKSTVIYGQGNGVPVAKVNWTVIREAITAEIGPEPITGLNAAKSAVEDAKKDKSLDGAYVKVGLDGSDLVLRIKDKRTFKDKEIDTTLIKGYKKLKAEYLKNLELVAKSDMVEVDPKVYDTMVLELGRNIMADAPNPTQVTEAKQAIANKDYVMALTKVGGLAKKVRNGLKNMNSFDDFIAKICKTMKWDPRHLDDKALSTLNKKRKEVIGVLEKTNRIVEKWEEEVEEMESKLPTPTTTSTDPAYQQRFNLILKTNKAIVEEVKTKSAQAASVRASVEKLVTAGKAIKTAEQATQVINSLGVLETRFRKILTEAIDIHYPMRKGLGTSDTKTMSLEDKRDVFGPINQRGMDWNGKTLDHHVAIVSATEPFLNDLASRFPELREGALAILGEIKKPLPEKQ